MTNVHDVATYILQRLDMSVSTMKLQKLTFFSQGWSLALLDQPLFDEDFQAWKNGPVCYELFNRHRGLYSVSVWQGDPSSLDESQRIVLDASLNNYGALTGIQLSELTHMPGSPWAVARSIAGINDGSFSQVTIAKPIIGTYFKRLLRQQG